METQRAGFSLVEILVVAALLSFALLAVSLLFVFGIKHNNWARDETVLVSLAQRKMEELRGVSPSMLYTDPWSGSALSTFGASASWRCLSDPDPANEDNWSVVGLAPHWTAADFAGDDIQEDSFRWNYCVYPVTYGNCRDDGTTCGPDAVGTFTLSRKLVVEVCRRKERDAEQRRGRRAHCVKLEMYR